MDMMKLGKEVADYLTKNVGNRTEYVAHHYKNLDNCVVIRHQNSDPHFGIVIVHREGDKKFIIKGTYPTAQDGREFPSSGEQSDSIGVSDNRTSTAVAKEIARRFLIPYIEVFTGGITSRNAHNVYLDHQKMLTEHFARLLHGKVKESGDRIDGGPNSSEGRGYLWDMFVNATDTTVNMDIRGIPAMLAEKMLKVWLDGWTPKQEK